MSKLYAIPDIHGRLDLLSILWDKLIKEEQLDLTQDKVIFLGDMIDRGPDSMGVIEFIKQLTLLHPQNVIALLGNHEAMALMAQTRGTTDDKELWEWNGGVQTLDSYRYVGFSNMTQDHLTWIAYLPHKHEEPGYYFSHSPTPRESYRPIYLKGTELTIDEHTWTYHQDEWGVARDHGNGIVGVSGHIHALRRGIYTPRIYDHHIYLDLGCGCSPKAPLCAMELHSRKVIYAKPTV
jgi:hypothetical protein